MGGNKIENNGSAEVKFSTVKIMKENVIIIPTMKSQSVFKIWF